MKQRLLQSHKIICKLALISLFMVLGANQAYSQTPPPAPAGQSNQYFCSATSWLSAGFTEPDDTFEELYLYGEGLKFYTDQALTTQVPVTTPLADGSTYYVTQTVGGVESGALTVDVTDRDCGCIKNHNFESYDGTADTSGYEAFDETYQQGHKTCGGTTAAATPIPIAGVNSGDQVAPVSNGLDGNSPLQRTNANNVFSEYGLRINNGDGHSSPNGNVDHVTKDFIAGEVFVFNFATILENPPSHDYDEQPYLYIAIFDENGDKFTSRCVVSQTEDCILFGTAGDILYSDWSCLKINTLPLQGQKATVQFTVADCTLGGHWGYTYVDDIFVGDNVDSNCDSPSFGYIAMESVTSSPSTLDCVVDIAGTVQSCGDDIAASVPFPIDVCGTIKTPISNGNAPNLDDLTLSISQNGVQVGTATNPVINGDQFCFSIDASDVNVSPYGEFEISSTVEFTLDCGDPYDLVITDNANVDICPTANCVAPLNTCDSTGTGIGTFDLSQAESQIRGSNWTAADVDISFYETELDAVDQLSEIATPTAFDNSTPYQQVVFARLDWHPQGTVTNCFYVIKIDLNVYSNPLVDLPTEIVACGPGGISEPIVATPTNITDLQNVTYTWKRNDVLIPFTGSYYVANKTGTYTVEISEENCSITKTVEVKYVEFEVNLGDSLVDLCGTADVYTITAEVEDIASDPSIVMSDVTYVWNTGETTKSIDVSNSGTYTVDVTYEGCTVTNMVDVIIRVRPEVSLGVDQIICANEETEIQANVSNFENSQVEFTWYHDGGVISGEATSSIIVKQEGTYKVEVNEIGSPDCFGESIVNIEYYENANCILPQGLSPDTTPGQNDCFDLEFLNDRTGIENLKIFNRYGRLVFEANNYVDSFCGNDKDGNKLTTGTYFYVMVLKGEDAVFGKTKKGYIYINREVN